MTLVQKCQEKFMDDPLSKNFHTKQYQNVLNATTLHGAAIDLTGDESGKLVPIFPYPLPVISYVEQYPNSIIINKLCQEKSKAIERKVAMLKKNLENVDPCMYCKEQLWDRPDDERTECSNVDCDRLICNSCKDSTNFDWIIQDDLNDEDNDYKYFCKECDDKRIHQI